MKRQGTGSIMFCRRRGGFTLLELVLAAAISAALAVALYTAMAVAFRARTSAAAQTGAMREASIVMDILQQDLQSILPPKGVLAGPFVGVATGSLGAESASLEFFTLGRDEARGGDDPLAEGMRRVEITLESDGQNTLLVRRVQPNILAQVEQELPAEVLATNVGAFAVRYYDGYDWTNEWDSVNEGDVLPLAVELTLRFDLASPIDASRPYEIVQIVPLSCGEEPVTETEVGGV